MHDFQKQWGGGCVVICPKTLYNKTSIRFGKCYQLITITSTLDIPDVTKTSRLYLVQRMLKALPTEERLLKIPEEALDETTNPCIGLFNSILGGQTKIALTVGVPNGWDH